MPESLKKPKVEQLETISYTDDGGGLLADVVFQRDCTPPLRFAVARGQSVNVEAEIKLPNRILVPPKDPTQLAAKGAVRLPSGATSYETQEGLLSEIIAFIRRFVCLPSLWEEIAAHYVLLTYVFDRFTALPYLRFIGEPGTGKTRALQVLGSIAARTMFLGGATSAASIFRIIEVFKGTLVFDEADMKHSDVWSEIVKILNTGYAPGLFVFRAENIDGRYEPCAYDVYGPKILTTRRLFEDQALESRCLTLHMQEGVGNKGYPAQFPLNFESEALRLRNKLLQWRFDNYFRISADESVIPSRVALEPRLIQIGIPMLSIATDDGFKNRFCKFLNRRADEQRQDRPQAIIVEALRSMNCAGKIISIKDLASHAQEIANRNGTENTFSPKFVGILIRGLGLDPKRAKDGYRVTVSEMKFKEIDDRYPAKE